MKTKSVFKERGRLAALRFLVSNPGGTAIVRAFAWLCIVEVGKRYDAFFSALGPTERYRLEDIAGDAESHAYAVSRSINTHIEIAEQANRAADKTEKFGVNRARINRILLKLCEEAGI